MQDRITYLTIILFIFSISWSQAQLSGTIYDESGKPLSFVTVYKEGTSKGTVSNIEGEYSLTLDSGDHTIVYKYIGYEEHKEVISITDKLAKDVVLNEASIAIQEIVVSADAEDPAYRVIRAAIKARDSHKDNVEKYQVDLYVKGVVKMLKVPKKILGQEIGDMEGMLDSTGQGIVYLAESQSTISFHQPNLLKEEMYSSIVAEDDGSYNFNRFIGANFDIYEEYYEFNRSIIGPLADNALLFYKYRMIESKVDQNGRMINRIQVIPKSSARPTVFGELYIIEDEWLVKELDLSFTGKAIKEPFFDTITIKQVHLPVEKDKWKVFSQTMSFSIGAFGFKIGGGFTYIFSDYNLNPDFDQSFFGNEEFRMEESAIKTDSSFWSNVRPVRLTEEERYNYIKKDSLKKVWASKEYKDSLDRVNNKFSIAAILFGYSNDNSYRKRYLTFPSPLGTYNFNPVTGHSLNLGMNYVKLDSSENRRFNINSKLGYGFDDQRIKAEAFINLRTNRKYWENWSIRIGDANRQFNEDNPVISLIDTWTSLFNKDNQARYFRKKFIGVQYQREIANGIFLRSGLVYSNRSALINTSDFSFRNKDAEFATNQPFNPTSQGLFFDTHNDLKFSLNVRFRIGQKYGSFPKFRIRNPSGWPDLWLRYDKGLALGDTDYDKLTLRIEKNNINFKLFGYSNFNIVASTFLTSKKVEFIDSHHFMTNVNLVTLRSRYMTGFKMMPHYTYSTTNDYVVGFYEHNLDGYLLDLIPLVNKLGWKSVISGNALIRKDETNYFELAAGISDVKIGKFSLFRLDYVWSYGNDGLLDRGFVIGLSAMFE
ncbi:MAG: hypothetical protein ACJA1A_002131 [Saprospiraceae bacterium]|jgi:hypothetical protein